MEKLRKLLTFLTVLLLPCVAAATPSSVNDLTAAGGGFRHVWLSWTTPYDAAASTTPAYYEVRVSTYKPLITDADWDTNSTQTGFPYRVRWSTAGTVNGGFETRAITGLVNDRTYFFALKTSTDNAAWSTLDPAGNKPFAQPYNSAPYLVVGHNRTNGVILDTNTPTLAWSMPSPGINGGDDDAAYGDAVAQYVVELCKDTSFAVKTVKDGLPSNSWKTDPLEENTTYYWRVRAGDAEGLYSAGHVPQTGIRFIVNAVDENPAPLSLVLPTNGSISALARPTFQWGASADPDPGDSLTYAIFYSTMPDFALDVTTGVAGITSTWYMPDHDLLENSTYYWKACAVDDDGLWSLSSATFTVAVNATPYEPPLPFSQSIPVDGSTVTVTAPIVDWEPTVDPDPGESFTYTLLYSSQDATFSTYTTAVTGLQTTYYQMPDLAEDAVDWWQVQADDGNSGVAITATRNFTVNAQNGAPAVFALVASSGTVASQTPLFSWEAGWGRSSIL
jgi:hypothetical protein